MKYAFILMGKYQYGRDEASISGGLSRMIGVSNLDEACDAAKKLQAEGVGCIELCGAFGEDGARKIIEATGGTLPVGFVVHFPEQDDLFLKAFPHDKDKKD